MLSSSTPLMMFSWSSSEELVLRPVLHQSSSPEQDMMLQGCAIVEFESAEQAAEAINTLHLSKVRSTVLFGIDALPTCPVVCPSCAVLGGLHLLALPYRWMGGRSMSGVQRFL